MTQPHPRLRLDATYKVIEGLRYSLIGPVFRAVTGVPFYALYALTVAGGAARTD